MRRLLFIVVMLLGAAECYAGSQTASSLTAGNVIDRARVIVGDTSTVIATNAQMVVWVNEAVHRIAQNARCLETSEARTLTATTDSYTTSTAHYDIEAVKYDNGDSTAQQRYWYLEKTDPKDLWYQFKESGRPKYWYEWNSKVYLWPVPGTDETGDTITIFEIAVPTGVTATTSAIETPYYFDEALVYYTVAKYLEADAKPGTAAYYRSLFDAEVTRYAIEIRKDMTNIRGPQ